MNECVASRQEQEQEMHTLVLNAQPLDFVGHCLAVLLIALECALQLRRSLGNLGGFAHCWVIMQR